VPILDSISKDDLEKDLQNSLDKNSDDTSLSEVFQIIQSKTIKESK